MVTLNFRPPGTAAVKTVFLIVATILISTDQLKPEVLTALCVGVLFLPAFSCYLSIYWPGITLRSRRLFPNSDVFWLLPLLLLLLQLRLTVFSNNGEPPRFWYGQALTAPRYDRAMLADVSIEGRLTKQIYLARVNTIRFQSKIGWRQHRNYQTKTKKRSSYSKPRKPLEYDPGEISPFTIALRINDYKLHANCQLRLQLRGRATPQPLSASSFHSYLRRKGATSYLWVSNRYHLLEKKCGELPWRREVRLKIAEAVEQRLRAGPELSGVALGLLFGDASGAGRQFKRDATRLGILHLFAASGLHLAIFYGCLYWPLSRRFGKRHPVALWLPLPLIFIYLWLLDFPLSFLRATIFVLLYAIKGVVHRRLTTGSYLLNAALITLLLLPQDFCSISGALSFGATSGIIYFHRTLTDQILRFKGRLGQVIAAQLALSIAATLLTTPVLILAFKAHSFSSLVINSFMVPLVSLLLPLLYLCTALEMVAGSAMWLSYGWSLVEEGLLLFYNATKFLAEYALYRPIENLVSLPMAALLLLGVALLAVRFLSRDSPVFGRSEPTRGVKNALLLLRTAALLAILLLSPPGAMLLDLIDLIRLSSGHRYLLINF